MGVVVRRYIDILTRIYNYTEWYNYLQSIALYTVSGQVNQRRVIIVIIIIIIIYTVTQIIIIIIILLYII